MLVKQILSKDQNQGRKRERENENSRQMMGYCLFPAVLLKPEVVKNEGQRDGEQNSDAIQGKQGELEPAMLSERIMRYQEGLVRAVEPADQPSAILDVPFGKIRKHRKREDSFGRGFSYWEVVTILA
jgi:hypothetical protein